MLCGVGLGRSLGEGLHPLRKNFAESGRGTWAIGVRLRSRAKQKKIVSYDNYFVALRGLTCSSTEAVVTLPDALFPYHFPLWNVPP